MHKPPKSFTYVKTPSELVIKSTAELEESIKKDLENYVIPSAVYPMRTIPHVILGVPQNEELS